MGNMCINIFRNFVLKIVFNCMVRKVRYILVCVLGDWFIFVWNFISYFGIFIFIIVCCIKYKV